MTPLFSTIAEHQPFVPGWCSPDKAATLASLVVGYRPSVSVEIGVFGGSSFLPIALAHKAIRSGVAIGIEPWNKAVAVAAQTEDESRKWWSELDFVKLENDFRAKLKELDLDEVVRIIRRPSNTVEAPQEIGLLHIDGAHNDEAIADVTRYAGNVTKGGFCVMDDLHWSGGGVEKAERTLIGMGFIMRYPLGTGAVYQRL